MKAMIVAAVLAMGSGSALANSDWWTVDNGACELAAGKGWFGSPAELYEHLRGFDPDLKDNGDRVTVSFTLDGERQYWFYTRTREQCEALVDEAKRLKYEQDHKLDKYR
jgi:hypothetical protein